MLAIPLTASVFRRGPRALAGRDLGSLHVLVFPTSAVLVCPRRRGLFVVPTLMHTGNFRRSNTFQTLAAAQPIECEQQSTASLYVGVPSSHPNTSPWLLAHTCLPCFPAASCGLPECSVRSEMVARQAVHPARKFLSFDVCHGLKFLCEVGICHIRSYLVRLSVCLAARDELV